MMSPRIPALAFLAVASFGTVEAIEPGHYVPGIANIRDFSVPATAGFYYA
jgi:hypothetical protein